MGSKERQKGTRLESHVVDVFEKATLTCERTWGSNGRSRGLPEHVDNVASISGKDLWIQCKNDEALPTYLWANADFAAGEGLWLTETASDRTFLVVSLAHFVQVCQKWNAGGDAILDPEVIHSYHRKQISELIKPVEPVMLQCVKRNRKPALVVIPLEHIGTLERTYGHLHAAPGGVE